MLSDSDKSNAGGDANDNAKGNSKGNAKGNAAGKAKRTAKKNTNWQRYKQCQEAMLRDNAQTMRC